MTGPSTGPRIAIVGGIFDKPVEYTSRVMFTTETMLVDGLRERGWDVTGIGHHALDAGVPYDLVHVHHIGRAAVRMALSGSDARFVYTSHDPWLASGREVSRNRLMMSKLIVGRADATVALSPAELATDAARYGDARAHEVVIPNGFPSDTYHYAPPPAGNGRPSILFVGQLIPFKGVDVLLKAFAEVDPDADLLLAYQNDTLEDEYRKMAANLDIADRVKFLGMQSSTQLADRYRAAAMHVSSSFAEALPSVVIEALMCGTPEIATDVGGVEWILGGKHTMLEPGDVGALAAAIRHRLANPATPEERAANSAEATTRFSPAAMVVAHDALYRELLSKPGGPHRKRRVTHRLHPVASAILDRADRFMVGRGFLE